MNGTSAENSGAAGSKGSRGIERPSTIGAMLWKPAGVALMICSMGRLCSLAVSVAAMPSLSSMALAVAVACSGRPSFRAPPLSATARWNRPLAAGMPIRQETFPAPPDSPKMVTFPGSPPKAEMLSRTHSSAATQSSIPTLATPAKAGFRSPR